MNKRVLISAVSVLSLAAVIGTLSLTNNKYDLVFAKEKDNYEPKLILNKSNMSVPVYDEDNYVYTTTISSTITGGFGFSSVSFDAAHYWGTYLYGDEGDYSFTNPNNMFEFTANYNEFSIIFPIHIIATFDLEHSFVVYKEGDSKEEQRFNFAYDSDDGDEYLFYKCNPDFYSSYGVKFEILRIELNWTC